MHQVAPNCTKLHQTAPSWTKVHQAALSYTNLHQVSPNFTNLHQISPICLNAKKVWNAVNEVCSRNSTSESIQCIVSDGIQHTTPKSIASAINSFFVPIGKRLADNITTTWPSCNSNTDLPKSQFQLAELEESFVSQQLLALKTNKAISLDKVSAKKTCSKTLLIRLHYLLLSYWIYQLKLVNFLNCGNVLKLQPCLSQGTRQMHQTTDLSLFCLHSARFLRKLYIHSYTSSWLPINSSQENSLDSGRDCRPLYLLWHPLPTKSFSIWNRVDYVEPCFWT